MKFLLLALTNIAEQQLLDTSIEIVSDVVIMMCLDLKN